MPAKKTMRRVPANRVEESEPEDGLVIRLAERALDNPAMSGGLLVMGLTAMAIVSNAMFLQNARHPDPLFMTRPAPAVAEQPEASVPIPRPRVEPAEAAAVVPAPVAAAIAPAEESAPTTDKATIAAIQRALLSRGYYKGAVDGRMGSRTRAAILAYQDAEGMKASGVPSAALLEHLRTAPVKPATVAPHAPAPVKLPPAPVGPAASAAPAATPAVAEAVPLPAVAAPAAETADPIAAVVAPEAEPVAAAPAPSDAAVAAARRTISVQTALNEIGYGPVPADGMLNDETVNAIRRFELDNGMAITGRIGDGLLNRLVSIGAIGPG